MTKPMPTADQLETVLRATLACGDMVGAHAALTLLAACDPKRAEQLLEVLQLAIAMAEDDLGNAKALP